MKVYGVKAVANLTGVNPHTLRAWERRYGLVKPDRLDNGRRAYSSDQVERIKFLGILVGKGYAISQIANLEDQQLKELIAPGRKNAQDKAASDPIPHDAKTRILISIERHLRSFDLRKVQQELSAAAVKYSGRDFALEVVSPLMQKVGDMTAVGKLSIAQEHALSAVLRTQMCDMFLRMRSLEDTLDVGGIKRITIASQEGDHHEFGVLTAALLCSGYGIHVRYLGPNMPAESLGEAAHALQSDIVLAALALTPGASDQSIAYIEALDKSMPNNIAIWTGAARKEPQFTNPDREFKHFATMLELENHLIRLDQQH